MVAVSGDIEFRWISKPAGWGTVSIKNINNMLFFLRLIHLIQVIYMHFFALILRKIYYDVLYIPIRSYFEDISYSIIAFWPPKATRNSLPWRTGRVLPAWRCEQGLLSCQPTPLVTRKLLGKKGTNKGRMWAEVLGMSPNWECPQHLLH